MRPDLAYYISRMAFLPNAIKLYLHVPWIAEFLFKINNAIMRDERNGLTEHFKYRLSMIASRENACTYCTAHHAATLKRRWGYDDEPAWRKFWNTRHRRTSARPWRWSSSARPARPVRHDPELRARLAKLFTPQEVMEIVLRDRLLEDVQHHALGHGRADRGPRDVL